MENWNLLACHHRQVVDDFIEAALYGMGLDGVERNVAGVALRSEVDSAGAALLSENLALLPGESEVSREFSNCLWELASAVDRPGRRCLCRHRD